MSKAGSVYYVDRGGRGECHCEGNHREGFFFYSFFLSPLASGGQAPAPQHTTHTSLTMASPEPDPTAPPRRGKFLSIPTPTQSSSITPGVVSSLPPLSSSSQTRGKFLENKQHASSITSASDVGGGGNCDASSELDAHDDVIRENVRDMKVSSAARREEIECRRRSVLADLDDAEEIVLALLETASAVASALSEMTTARSKKRHGGEGRRNNAENGDGATTGGGGDTFEELATNVRVGGAVYSSGVRRLHELLAPHAHYVKSLNERDGRASDDNGKRSNDSSTVTSPGGAIPTDGARCGIVEEATSNMYAVRVKNRLAMERCEVLRQMIQLEEDEIPREGNEDVRVEAPSDVDTAGSKRKHDSIEIRGSSVV